MQGGHVALKTGLAYTPRLAGILAASTWIEPNPAGLQVQVLLGPRQSFRSRQLLGLRGGTTSAAEVREG